MNTPINSEGLSVRVKTPQRRQMQMHTHSLDQLLADDHQARVLWQYVCSLDLSALYWDIQAVDGGRGRDAVDPRILLCLWLLATLEGISSARRLAVLCEREQLHQQRERRKKGSGSEARASTTDPESRNMKMADGGYRPAYNVQFATTCEGQLIVGVDVTNQGTDAGPMGAMVEQIETKYGRRPHEYLAGGGSQLPNDPSPRLAASPARPATTAADVTDDRQQSGPIPHGSTNNRPHTSKPPTSQPPPEPRPTIPLPSPEKTHTHLPVSVPRQAKTDSLGA